MLFNPLKVEELDKFRSKAAIKYYVNATTGSDDNDGLTADTAFKTIQHAVDVLPKWLEHAVEILLAPGTYDKVTIAGFHGNSKYYGWGTSRGAAIRIRGGSNTNDGTADNYIVNGVCIGDNSTKIFLQGFTSKPTIEMGSSVGTYAAFALPGRGWVGCENCKAMGDSASQADRVGFAIRRGGEMWVDYCGAYNVATGVGVSGGSLFCVRMSGSGVGTGYWVNNAGMIQDGGTWGAGTTYTCTTKYKSEGTGIIVNASGELV